MIRGRPTPAQMALSPSPWIPPVVSLSRTAAPHQEPVCGPCLPFCLHAFISDTKPASVWAGDWRGDEMGGGRQGGGGSGLALALVSRPPNRPPLNHWPPCTIISILLQRRSLLQHSLSLCRRVGGRAEGVVAWHGMACCPIEPARFIQPRRRPDPHAGGSSSSSSQLAAQLHLHCICLGAQDGLTSGRGIAS